MDENIDHNQSGNPVQWEEEKTETDLKEIIDQESINQASGALEMSYPVNNLQLIEHINQPFHRMVVFYLI